MTQVASNSQTVLPADELLQEQKADMDQFLSSISESQLDVTVSSEESVEVPVSEGKPYRPFQVTSLGSRLEPEGEQPRRRVTVTDSGIEVHNVGLENNTCLSAGHKAA